MTDWDRLSRTPNLPIEILRNERDNLNWRLVQRNTHLTQEMLVEFSDKIDWHLYFIMQPYYISERARESIQQVS
jgi:hypothetical protein